MADFTKLPTLLNALDTHEVRDALRCLEQGQSLNQSHGHLQGSILHEAISCSARTNFASVQTMLALQKHGLDLNMPNRFGVGPIWTASAAASGNVLIVHYLIQCGAELNDYPSGFTVLDIACGNANEKNKAEFLPCQLMLLSAGAKSNMGDGIPVFEEVKQEVRRWLAGLDAAKYILAKTFKAVTVEQLICEFVYNENALKNVL